ncbi:MAG: hypothetical protein JZU47_02415 [Prolixibacteraceae bacterium]|nr:hypothetical protein [Prolixibacteraceae bacterium]
MKKWLCILTALTVFTVLSCKKTDDYSGNLGGSTDLTSNAVGFKYTGSLKIGNSSTSTDAKAEVIKNGGGITEIKGTGTLPAKIKSLITSSSYVNANGVVNVSGKFVNSTEGVAYVNASGDQVILVKYDAKVGDQWSYTTKGGKSITRKVTAVSTTDDFFWSGMLIKAITVEQNLPYPGFTKAVYRANHKFGVVQVEVFLEDGTSMAMSF